MIFNKFMQRTDRYSKKISLFHIILLSCLFVVISACSLKGGIMHHESYFRMLFYLSDIPLLNKIYDSAILEKSVTEDEKVLLNDFFDKMNLGDSPFRARELSYLFDFIDFKFIELCIDIGYPHFLSLTHYLISIAIGCLLWLFCVKELRLNRLFGVGWLTLFWTSPTILGGGMNRTGKILVAFLVAVLFYVIYKFVATSKEESNAKISGNEWFLYTMSIFSIPLLDEQGLFFAIAIILCLALWGFFVRQKNIYIMLWIGMASILFYGVYRYIIAPQLTFVLNGYWPLVSFEDTIPYQFSVKNSFQYLSSALSLYIDNFRFLLGNSPPLIGIVLIIFCIFSPLFYLSINPDLSANHKKIFILSYVELLMISFVMLIIMYSIMVYAGPFITLPHRRLGYYWLPTIVIFVMTFAIMTKFFIKLGIPKWLLLMLMCIAIVGNILAIPQHKNVAFQSVNTYLPHSSSLLNALRNLDSLNDVKDPLVKKDPVFKFFKCKKEISPYCANVYNEMGIYYTKSGLDQMAIDRFNKGIQLYPDFTNVYISNRGIVYLNKGKYIMGCHDLKRACELKTCKPLKRAKSQGYCL